MIINGKQDHFQLADLIIAVGVDISLPRPDGNYQRNQGSCLTMAVFAGKAGLSKERISDIAGYYRLDLSDSRKSSLF